MHVHLPCVLKCWPKIDATPQSKLSMPSLVQSLTQKSLPYSFNLWYLKAFVNGGRFNASTFGFYMAIPKC